MQYRDLSQSEGQRTEAIIRKYDKYFIFLLSITESYTELKQVFFKI